MPSPIDPRNPGGPYGMGVIALAPAAPEPGNPDRAAPIVQIWYPTAPQAPEEFGVTWLAALAQRLGLDHADGQHDAAIALGTTAFPILLYFPGWEGTELDDQLLVRDFVGNGYVVATAIYPARLPGMTDATLAKQRADLLAPMDFSSEAAFHATLQRADLRVRQRAQDASSILDALTKLDANDPVGRFTHRLALDRAGIFGFSFGGAVAAQASWGDPRFKATLNMDGWHFGDAAKDGVTQPYLLMSDDSPLPTQADLASANPDLRYSSTLTQSDYDSARANLARNGGAFLTIAGTRHLNFTDQLVRSILHRNRGGGPIDPARAFTILTAYAEDFFGAQLEGQPSKLLAGQPSPYPEVRLEAWAGSH